MNPFVPPADRSEMTEVFRYESLLAFCENVFTRAGLPEQMASALSRFFLEADLLGISTHGVNRLSTNLAWIENGETKIDAEIETLKENAVVSVWDGHFLPGPWVVQKALDIAMARAKVDGMSIVSIRKVQHIACLAAYLERVTAEGLIPLILVSTPGERSVSAFGGISRVFSPAPLGLGVPTSSRPILIDTTMSIVAEGKVKQALIEGRNLALLALKDKDGKASDNPSDYWDEPAGSLMPIGGIDHGYKGTSLLILIEILTMALNGYGRLDGAEDGEANSVFVQVLDPRKFGGAESFAAEADDLVRAIRSSRVRPGEPHVRVPGDRALDLKARQIANGVALRPSVVRDLQDIARRYRCKFPEAATLRQAG